MIDALGWILFAVGLFSVAVAGKDEWRWRGGKTKSQPQPRKSDMKPRSYPSTSRAETVRAFEQTIRAQREGLTLYQTTRSFRN